MYHKGMKSVTNEALLKAYTIGYRPTPDGRVLSPKGRELHPFMKGPKGKEYCHFTVRMGTNINRKVAFHRLQAFHKYGEALFQPGIEVRHKNLNPSDNTWGNVLIGTRSQNRMDLPAERRRAISLKAHRIFSDELVIAMRKCRAEEHLSYRKIGARFGVSSSVVFFYLSSTAKHRSKGMPL